MRFKSLVFIFLFIVGCASYVYADDSDTYDKETIISGKTGYLIDKICLCINYVVQLIFTFQQSINNQLFWTENFSEDLGGEYPKFSHFNF